MWGGGARVNPGHLCFLLGFSGIFQTAAFDYSQRGLPQYGHEIASAASIGAHGASTRATRTRARTDGRARSESRQRPSGTEEEQKACSGSLGASCPPPPRQKILPTTGHAHRAHSHCSPTLYEVTHNPKQASVALSAPFAAAIEKPDCAVRRESSCADDFGFPLSCQQSRWAS